MSSGHRCMWIAQGWAIAAIVTLAILRPDRPLHHYGAEQFWRITGDYFTGPSSVKVWLWLGAILLIVVAGVRLQVLLSYFSNDMGNSFQVVAGRASCPAMTR